MYPCLYAWLTVQTVISTGFEWVTQKLYGCEGPHNLFMLSEQYMCRILAFYCSVEFYKLHIKGFCCNILQSQHTDGMEETARGERPEPFLCSDVLCYKKMCMFTVHTSSVLR